MEYDENICEKNDKNKTMKFVGDKDNIHFLNLNKDIQNEKNENGKDTNFNQFFKELNYEKIKKFIKENPNSDIINQQEKFTKSTLLLKSILQSENSLTEFLLNSKADPDLCNKSGESPLHFAVENSNYKIINLLLEKGADPNQQNQVINL